MLCSQVRRIKHLLSVLLGKVLSLRSILASRHLVMHVSVSEKEGWPSLGNTKRVLIIRTLQALCNLVHHRQESSSRFWDLHHK